MTDDSKTTPVQRDRITVILGFLVLLAFGGFVAYLLNHLDFTEAKWSRAIYLFAGVEAVAFAAACARPLFHLCSRVVDILRASAQERGLIRHLADI